MHTGFPPKKRKGTGTAKNEQTELTEGSYVRPKQMEKIRIKPKAAFFVLAIGTISIVVLALQKEKKGEGALVPLNAAVTFDGSRILVSNNDTIDYLSAEVTINGYYKISDMNLRAGETYTLWPVEFSHINGRRLPLEQKPQQFAIWCRLNEGRNGFCSVKFNTE